MWAQVVQRITAIISHGVKLLQKVSMTGVPTSTEMAQKQC